MEPTKNGWEEVESADNNSLEIIENRMAQVLSLIFNGDLASKYHKTADGGHEKRITIDPRAKVLTEIGREMNEESKRYYTFDLTDLNTNLFIELDKKATELGQPLITQFEDENLLYPLTVQFIPEVKLHKHQSELAIFNDENITVEALKSNASLINVAQKFEIPTLTTTGILQIMSASFMNFWELVDSRFETIKKYPGIATHTVQIVHPFFHPNTKINARDSLGYLSNLVPISDGIFQYGPKLLRKEIIFDLYQPINEAKLKGQETIIPVRSHQVFSSIDTMERKSLMGMAQLITQTQYLMKNILKQNNIPKEVITPVESLDENHAKVDEFILKILKNLPKIKES